MVVVKKQKGESEDKLIARFRKAVIDANIVPEARERSRYKSGSEKKKEQKKRIKQSIKQETKRNRR